MFDGGTLRSYSVPLAWQTNYWERRFGELHVSCFRPIKTRNVSVVDFYFCVSDNSKQLNSVCSYSVGSSL